MRICPRVIDPYSSVLFSTMHYCIIQTLKKNYMLPLGIIPVYPVVICMQIKLTFFIALVLWRGRHAKSTNDHQMKDHFCI